MKNNRAISNAAVAMLMWYRASDLYNNIKILGFKFVKETTTTETQIEEICHGIATASKP